MQHLTRETPVESRTVPVDSFRADSDLTLVTRYRSPESSAPRPEPADMPADKSRDAHGGGAPGLAILRRGFHASDPRMNSPLCRAEASSSATRSGDIWSGRLENRGIA